MIFRKAEPAALRPLFLQLRLPIDFQRVHFRIHDKSFY